MNRNCEFVPFGKLFDWMAKSQIKSGSGKANGKYKMFVCSDTDIKRYDEYLETEESLVFGTGGKASCHYVNEPFAYSTDCIVAQKKSDDVFTKFYYYFFRQNRLNLLQSTFTGSGLQHTSKTKIEKIIVPFISYQKQKYIVSKIEDLFSELDKAVETLQTTKKQLAVYRQAVLKEAFDTAIKTDDRISTPMLPIEELLIPNRKGMVTGPFGTMIKKHEHQSFGVPMLGIENIGNGKFIDGNKIFVTSEKAEELKAFALLEGDIIISRSGTVGELCIVPKKMEGALLSTNLMRVSLNFDLIRSDYFIYLFQSKGVVLDQVKELCKGSTRMFLNQTILKQIRFPVPDLAIQKNIVELIESRLSVCDSIEKTVDAVLSQAEVMRQSILKKAFKGEL